MAAYYNEFDPHAAAWLRELISAGLIAPGDVDERSISDVSPEDVCGYTQCHWFAGVAGWSIALRMAGWGDDRPVWTGSCPCQPFSAAGKRKGTDDERHLWPEMFRLIRECRPAVTIGEQVEAAVRLGWVDGVRADLEREGYAFGFHVLGAHSVGAPHIRQRIFWVAESEHSERWAEHEINGVASRRDRPGRGGTACGLPDAEHTGMECATRFQKNRKTDRRRHASGNCTDRWLQHSASNGRDEGRAESVGGSAAGGCSDHWSNYVLVPCGDGKKRRIKPGLEPLVNGVHGRASLLRGYGNAIVPEVAAEFVKAYLDC